MGTPREELGWAPISRSATLAGGFNISQGGGSKWERSALTEGGETMAMVRPQQKM